MKHRLAIWLVPLLVVAIGYSAALRVGLLSDDYEMLQSALHAPDAWSAFTLRGAWDRTWWRPWAIWSFYLEVHALGRAAWTFHAFSLVAHLASAILLGRLVARLTRDERAALVASALFAAMPVQAEAVTWISGRFDVLATLGTLLALVAWLRYAELGRKRDLALLLGAVVFALGSKETSALAPILLAGVTLVARIRPSRRLWIAWSVVIGLTIGWFLMRERALHSAELGFASGEREPGPDFSLDGIPRFVAHAMLACFVPSTGRSRPELLGLAPLLFVLATAVAFGVAVRSRTPATPARLWTRTTGFLGLFLLCVLPYSAWQGHLYPDLQSSRYLYLASAFACAALAPIFGAALASSSRSGFTLARLMLLFALGAQIATTREVNAHWVEAGAEARRIVAAFPLCDAASGPVYVSGLPDNHKGAYVFRNCFDVALAVDRGCAIAVLCGRAPSEGARSLHWNAASGSWDEAGGRR